MKFQDVEQPATRHVTLKTFLVWRVARQYLLLAWSCVLLPAMPLSLLITSGCSIDASRGKTSREGSVLSPGFFEGRLLDGGEPLLSFGMDTTKHWWAITEPFLGFRRLWIDGEKLEPFQDHGAVEFSQDGEQWAYWGLRNQQYTIVTQDTDFVIATQQAPTLSFSQNGEKLIYTLKNGSEEIATVEGRKERTVLRWSSFFYHEASRSLAYVATRGNLKTVVVNGKDGNLFEEIKPLGFWQSGEFVFSARNGNQWGVYQGRTEIVSNLTDIGEGAINRLGTTAAIIVRQGLDWSGMLFDDSFKQPLQTLRYDSAGAVTLHPNAPLFAMVAVRQGNHRVLFNSAEYSNGTVEYGVPKFTSDGNDLFYSAVDNIQFLSINGERFEINGLLPQGADIALKSGAGSFAHSTSQTLVRRNLRNQKIVELGTMMEQTSQTRYNRFVDRYEMLGRFNNRLYLLQCSP